MKTTAFATLIALAATPAFAQVNAGTLPEAKSLPFKMTEVAKFDYPWKIAFLPDGRMLVTEKAGQLWLVDVTTGSERSNTNARQLSPLTLRF